MYLIFARNQRVLKAGKIDDLLQLGYYRLDHGGICAFYSMNFQGSLNKPPTNSPYKHPTYFPATKAGPIQMPSRASISNLKGTWTRDARNIVVTLNGVRHFWFLANGVWSPKTPDKDAKTGLLTFGGIYHREAYGFGIESDTHTSTKPLTWGTFKSSYEGTQHTLISGAKQWIRNQPVRLNAHLFKGKGNVYGYKDWDNVPNRGVLWKFSTFLLNNFSNKLWVLNHGGYDYNKDKAANEPMHAYWYWCKMEESKVGEMVGIEYFQQNIGYPILSVVYYR